MAVGYSVLGSNRAITDPYSEAIQPFYIVLPTGKLRTGSPSKRQRALPETSPSSILKQIRGAEFGLGHSMQCSEKRTQQLGRGTKRNDEHMTQTKFKT